MTSPQTILITGGIGGLGLAMAKLFLARGDTVIAVDIRPSGDDLGELRFIQADITKLADRERVFAEAAAAGHAIDILVNNAAITKTHDYTNPFTLGADRAAAEIAINFAAPVDMCRLFLKGRQDSGRADPAVIVNIGAPGGLFPLEAIPLYSASKAGLHMFTLALRRQLRATPVKVLEVFPPSLDTPLAADIQVGKPSEHGAETIAQVAGEIVAGIDAGTETILPHKQTRNFFKALPQLDDAFIDMVNKGVVRRPGLGPGLTSPFNPEPF